MLGLWCANHPTSNVACERVFAVMRTIEDPQRGSLSRKNFAAEIKAKANKGLVEDMVAKQATMLRAIRTHKEEAQRAAEAAAEAAKHAAMQGGAGDE